MSRHSLLLKGFTLTLVLLQAGVAGAQAFLCLPGVSPRRIDGDLNVVTHCELTGTEVTGNVTLFAGGSLVARNMHIHGDLAGSSADYLDIAGGRIDKDLRLEQMVGDLIRIQGVELRGVVELLGNRSRLEVLDNEIQRDAEIDANVGGVMITGNTLEQNLRCADNDPAPLGADNDLHGNAEGQCADLQPEAPPAPPPPTPPPTTPPPTTPPPTTPPPTTPPPTTPPPTTPPPTTPPPASPPPASTPSANFVPDPNGGGGGAMGLGWILLLPFAVWRRTRSSRAG